MMKPSFSKSLVLALLLSFGMTSLLTAQPQQSSSSSEGVAMLQDLRTHLLGDRTLELDMHILAMMDQRIELFNDKAVLTLQGGNYRLEGEHFIFYADDASVWLYDPYAEELTVSQRVVDYTNFLENPLAVLQEEALAHFSVSSPEPMRYQGEDLQRLLLTSTEGTEAWVIEIGIGPQKNRLRYLNCVRGREMYQIQILGIRQHPVVDRSFFTPDASLQQASELVDLR